MYKDKTSSVTNNELEGRLPMVRSLLRKSLVSLTKDGSSSCELKVEGDSRRIEICVRWDGY